MELLSSVPTAALVHLNVRRIRAPMRTLQRQGYLSGATQP